MSLSAVAPEYPPRAVDIHDAALPRPSLRNARPAPAAEDAYTLADLLGRPEFGLRLLTGGPEALSLPLLSACAVEAEHPGEWLEEGCLVLTRGTHLRGKPQVQRALVAELHARGVSCLGFAIDEDCKGVPPALLDEARRRALPLVLVPADTTFQDLSRAVYQSTTSLDSRAFHRMAMLQRNMLQALTEPDPLHVVVGRLQRLVHGSVALLDPLGQLVTATGRLPEAQIAEALRHERPVGLVEVQVLGWRVIAAPVTTSGSPSAHWLVVGHEGAAASAQLTRTALQVTAPALAAVLHLTETRRGQDKAIVKTLLDRLLDGTPDAEEVSSAVAKLAALGLRADGDSRTVVVKTSAALGRSPQKGELEAVEAWLDGVLHELDAPPVLSRRDDELVVVVCGDRAFATVRDGLLATWPSVVLGVGRPHQDVHDVRASYEDAGIALQHLRLQNRDRVLHYDDLDIVTALLAEAPRGRLQAKVSRMTAILKDNPIQLEALRAYFAHNRDVKAAAESIHLHPNTLRYRLERLEHGLQRSLQEPSVTASLYCVLAMMNEGADV